MPGPYQVSEVRRDGVPVGIGQPFEALADALDARDRAVIPRGGSASNSAVVLVSDEDDDERGWLNRGWHLACAKCGYTHEEHAPLEGEQVCKDPEWVDVATLSLS